MNQMPPEVIEIARFLGELGGYTFTWDAVNLSGDSVSVSVVPKGEEGNPYSNMLNSFWISLRDWQDPSECEEIKGILRNARENIL